MAPPLLELGSSTAVCNAVAAGVGPALVSELAAAPLLATCRIEEVPTSGVDLHRRLLAVWRSGTSPSGAAAHLLTKIG
jgi:DNA-binding transcriptional LysR family regulator